MACLNEASHRSKAWLPVRPLAVFGKSYLGRLRSHHWSNVLGPSGSEGESQRNMDPELDFFFFFVEWPETRVGVGCLFPPKESAFLVEATIRCGPLVSLLKIEGSLLSSTCRFTLPVICRVGAGW